jgi:hypothetical protein
VLCCCSWLRPYPNGALPLLQIRSTLVDLLLLMNLDTSNDYTREKVEHSELGKILMFYANNQHENTSEWPQDSRCVATVSSSSSSSPAVLPRPERGATTRVHSTDQDVLHVFWLCLHLPAVSLKTKCRDLILAWSKPIFENPDAEQRKRRTREREHRCVAACAPW